MISPWTAGSGTDIIARLIAEKMSTELGVPVIVEPRPGAAGNIGSALAATQPADGNTLLVTSASFAISPAIYRNLSFDPVKNFVPVTKLATAPLLVLVRADSPLRTMADLIALTKKDPKSVNYGSFGNGSPSHLIGESINRLAGISMTHVPYSTGGAPLDLLGGRLTIAILDALSQTPQIKAGKMRALALNGLNRLPSIPDVPTLVESGIPFDTVGWQAVFAPAGVSPEIIEKLNKTINHILSAAVVQTQIHAVGCFPVNPPTTASQWGDMFKKDVQTWADLVKRSGAKID
jgi:tripartite-type tricarboxylate transporter receptor subunit TctC